MAARLKLWQVAEAYGTSGDSYFSKLLRREFSEAEKEKIRAIIADLKNEHIGG